MLPADLHRNAIAQLHILFVEAGAQVLTEAEVKEFKRRKYTNGWRIRLTDSEATNCTILADENLPWSAISVYADPSLYRVIPHVEHDGLVCTLSEHASIDIFNPLGVTEYVLTRVQDVLSAIQNENEHKDEFAREFLSYWLAGVRTPNVRSLAAVSGKPREAFVWRGKKFTLVGDNKDQIRKWLSHLDGFNRIASESTYPTETGIILPIDQTPLPSQYPSTSKHVLALAQKSGPKAEEILKQATMNRRTSLLVLFIGPTLNGPASFAVDLSPVPNQSQGPHKTMIDGLTKGFRPKRMPIKSVSKRVFVNRSTVQRKVERIDPSWVHGRDVVSSTSQLQSQHVVMLGCGSVGSTVALQLAKSGVGKLTLVDPDSFNPANASRHELGIDAVGGSKSELLRKRLLKQFPHMLDIRQYPTTWQTATRRHHNIFAEADLVISTIGSWTQEGSLNLDWLSKGRETPLVVGWTEPYAGAGHAVALGIGSGCLSCHFEYEGKSKLRVTKWPTSTLKQEPACAAMFQPYGAIELGHIHSLIGRAAIDVLTDNVAHHNRHRVWCAQHSLVRDNGGTWTDEWYQLHPKMPGGGFLWEREWAPNNDCLHCGGKV